MEDKFLIELLEAKYQETRDRFKDGKHTHEDLTVMMLKHQTNHIAHLEVDIDSRFDQIQSEIKRLDQKIDAVFWKMLGLFIAFSSIIIVLLSSKPH